VCLILIALRLGKDYPLVIAANRDEFFDRPTQAASWDTQGRILCGRDLRAGGTWLGITRDGRFAALTNYREPQDFRANAPSRGALVMDFLRGGLAPHAYLAGLSDSANEYNGFNLFVADKNEFWFYSNRGGMARELDPGLYGASNAMLDEPWPKLERAKTKMRGQIPSIHRDGLMSILLDTDQPDDKDLPDTGVGIEKERLLAPIFVRSETYGTRCSTVILQASDGTTQFLEATHTSKKACDSVQEFQFNR
jgi:uncharacterized protein with NRDE domain